MMYLATPRASTASVPGWMGRNRSAWTIDELKSGGMPTTFAPLYLASQAK
jgi:hypothetical protein